MQYQRVKQHVYVYLLNVCGNNVNTAGFFHMIYDVRKVQLLLFAFYLHNRISSICTENSVCTGVALLRGAAHTNPFIYLISLNVIVIRMSDCAIRGMGAYAIRLYML